MLNAKTWKPVIAVILILLVFPETGYCDSPYAPVINELMLKCFKDPDSGYAAKKILDLKVWMSHAQSGTSPEARANKLALSGFESVKFKWKLINSPVNVWHEDMAIFYFLVQHDQIKFSKGMNPATCEYTRILGDPRAETRKARKAPENKQQKIKSNINATEEP